MFKNKDDEKKADAAPSRDEHAYEDSWYRSLKALREQSPNGEGAAEDDEGSAGVESEEPSETAFGAIEDATEPSDDREDATFEAAGVDDDQTFQPSEDGEFEPSEAAEPARFERSEVAARAGALLERLRALQHLGDE